MNDNIIIKEKSDYKKYSISRNKNTYKNTLLSRKICSIFITTLWKKRKKTVVLKMSLKPKIFKNSAEKKSDFFLFAVPTGVDACAGQVETGRGMETREKEEGIYKKKCAFVLFRRRVRVLVGGHCRPGLPQPGVDGRSMGKRGLERDYPKMKFRLECMWERFVSD